jgi:hypothetical protein
VTYHLRDDLVAAIAAGWPVGSVDKRALTIAVTTALDSEVGRRVRNLLHDERDVKAEIDSIVEAARTWSITGTDAAGQAALDNFVSIHGGACPEVLAAARAS